MTGWRPRWHVESLLAAERELDGPPVHSWREQARRELVGERLALAAEAAAHRGPMTRMVAAGISKHLGELAVDVVRRLRRGPERHLAVGARVGDRGVLLHRRRGSSPRRRRCPRARGRPRRSPPPRRRTAGATSFMTLPRRRLVVDLDVLAGQRLFDRHAARAAARTPPRSAQRGLGGLLVHRADRGHRIADIAHACRWRRDTRPGSSA